MDVDDWSQCKLALKVSLKQETLDGHRRPDFFTSKRRCSCIYLRIVIEGRNANFFRNFFHKYVACVLIYIYYIDYIKLWRKKWLNI